MGQIGGEKWGKVGNSNVRTISHGLTNNKAQRQAESCASIWPDNGTPDG